MKKNKNLLFGMIMSLLAAIFFIFIINAFNYLLNDADMMKQFSSLSGLSESELSSYIPGIKSSLLYMTSYAVVTFIFAFAAYLTNKRILIIITLILTVLATAIYLFTIIYNGVDSLFFIIYALVETYFIYRGYKDSKVVNLNDSLDNINLNNDFSNNTPNEKMVINIKNVNDENEEKK
ncbi:MAG: hypothetical protein LBR40_00605 [Bacilli bacterium]|jgi:hypothetical protein|nr:hypothetical protein [Bacilli bacterium]